MKILLAPINLFRIIAVFAVMPLSVSAQQVITLQQAVDKALQNNIQVKQSQFSEALSEESLRQSKDALLPTLNGSTGLNSNFGRSIDPSTNQFITQQFTSVNANLSAGVDLFGGLRKINQIKQNKILLSVDKTNTEKIKNDLILSVVTAYMQILFNKDLLETAKQQQAVAAQTLKQQQELLDVGNRTLADLSEAKSQVAAAELTVTTAQNALTISYLNLSQLMEMPSDAVYEVQAPLIDAVKNTGTSENISEIYNSALKTFPDIKLASLRTEAAKKDVEIAKASYYPRLSLGAGLGTNYSSGRNDIVSIIPNGFREIGRTSVTNEAVVVPNFTTITAPQTIGSQFKENFNQSVGISLSLPIFNGFNARSGVRRAKISYQNTQLNETLVRNNLNKVISQAVADLKAAKDTYIARENAFAAQKDAFYVIEERYNVGLVNSLDYTTSRTNRNRAEIDFIQAKYDLIFRAKVIDYYLGKQITF